MKGAWRGSRQATGPMQQTVKGVRYLLLMRRDPKRMIQQTLTHASYYKILTPDPNFPDEPKNVSMDV
jgi:hypothetical protein